MGENQNFNMSVGGIERIYLQCDTGYTAMVRIFSSGKRPVNQERDVNGL
jgi:hypothetical protein